MMTYKETQPPFTSDAKTILIRGGPGTGKTACLKRRFLYLVREKQIPTSSILVFTFSSASAKQFRHYLERESILKHQELHVHTFHSFALAVVNSIGWSDETGGMPVFISPFKEYLIVKEILQEKQSNLKGLFGKVAGKDGFARELSDFFKLLKQNLLAPEKFAAVAKRLSPELSDLSDLYSSYDEFLREKEYAGFSDMVARAIQYFRKNPPGPYTSGDVLHVLVDEFEEIDPAQLELLKTMLTQEISLAVAGNEEERIFGFRGSGAGRFAALRQLRQPVEEYVLDTNHRLPKVIADAADAFILQKPVRIPQLERDRAALEIIRHKDPVEQAYEVARNIKRTVAAGDASSYSDFVVLCRSTSRSVLPLQEALAYYNIPHSLYNSTSFSMHRMVRLLSDLITVLSNPVDDAALERALHAPALGLDAIELKKAINTLSESPHLSLYESFHQVLAHPEKYPSIRPAFQEQLRKALAYIAGLRKKLDEGEALVAVVRSIMRDFFFADIVGENQEEGARDASYLRLFDQILCDIEEVLLESQSGYSLQAATEYLEHAFAHFANQQENSPSGDDGEGVRIMTVHQAKGLEFPFVYIVDATDEHFPSLNSDVAILNARSLRLLRASLKKNFDASSFSSPYFRFMMSPKQHLQEERQLLYVAITRASRGLRINYTEESHLGEPVGPSPFTDELLAAGSEVRVTAAEADSCGILSQLAGALNREEIEYILHRCVHPVAPGDIDQLRTRISSLGLDSEYICTETPFKRESAEAPRIDPHIFSASQLHLYLTCPRLFFYERLLRLSAVRRREFDLGELIHCVLEQFHTKHPVLEGDLGRLGTDILTIFSEVWNGAAANDAAGFGMRFSLELLRSAVKKKAEEILRRYVRTEAFQETRAKTVACEEQIEFCVRGLPFRAVIDRIDELKGGQGHRVVDYKTSQSGPIGARTIKKLFLNLDEKDEYLPQDFQMPLYLLAAKAGGYDPVELVYYWVAQENAKGMFKKSILRVGEGADCLRFDELEAVKDAIEKISDRILAGDFPPQPRSKYECQRCSFERICGK